MLMWDKQRSFWNMWLGFSNKSIPLLCFDLTYVRAKKFFLQNLLVQNTINNLIDWDLNRYLFSRVLHNSISLSLSLSLPSFSWGLRRQQLEIKSPNITVFRHLHHFTWAKVKCFHRKFAKKLIHLVLLCRTGLFPFASISKAFNSQK